MKILVFGNDRSWEEITAENHEVEWVRINDIMEFGLNEADGCFNLYNDASLHHYHWLNKPLFINSTCKTLNELKATENIVRINGWKGFLKRPVWEIAGTPGPAHQDILSAIKKKVIVTPDKPGFISARIIAMIINEAFFAKEENVSTEDEIDIAMKLGTNYPYGPFEWAEIIGLKNIYELLTTLASENNLYQPSSLLAEKVMAL